MDSFDREWQRWFPEGGRRSPPRNIRRSGIGRVLILLAALVLLFVILNVAKGFFTEWLWFSSMGYGSVLTTVLGNRILIFLITAIAFGGFFLSNLILATRLSPRTETRLWSWSVTNQLQQLVKWATILGTTLLSIIFGLVAQGNWETVLRFLHRQPFGIADPLFLNEVGFYVFSLPFYQLIRGWLVAAMIITLLATAGVYLFSYFVQRIKFNLTLPTLAHLGGLVLAVLGLFAWGYRLSIWELVFSQQGVVFGAGYTDVHARMPAQWALFGIVIILMVLVIVSIWQRRVRWTLYGLGLWVAASLVIGVIYPAIVQRFQVQPNELARETPYIGYNIQFTREAFALNLIEEQPFPAEESPTAEDITENNVTISNIRLWDPRPLADTYKQLHSIRLYYDFHDVDVDRYFINGYLREVMLSARELSVDRLSEEAQTWVNRTLQFTHGYGAVISPVNEITPQGLPVLWLENIPPMGIFDIERPEIYFGEKTNDYVIVGTTTDEFNYPRGTINVYSKYEGTAGVRLNSFLRRLIYAWQLGDLNILISSELSPESRVLYQRNIKQRVNHIAPFLTLDDDPYLVIIDGRFFWIQDAYTATDRYPYSEPTRSGVNYIRNSVKIVIDAYNGDATFYVTDPRDAIIKTYQDIFPDLFRSAEEMPDTLRAHWRYPEDLFSIQASVYQKYHMRDVRVFYNQEDLWAVPQEFYTYAGARQPMLPYYIVMRLPGAEQEEFLLMLPFTPANKNNAISWLAARCDSEYYGKLLVYSFPKERVVKGPSQIEDRIQQDTTITEQLALWSQGGSRVIRGNLLLIPIGQSKIYVEPVFLQAENGGLPELKRVIVVAGEQIAMEPTLQESIAAIFGIDLLPTEPPPVIPTEPPETAPEDVLSLIQQAQEHYDKAMEFLKAGDWSGYGQELEALKAVLDQMATLLPGEENSETGTEDTP